MVNKTTEMIVPAVSPIIIPVNVPAIPRQRAVVAVISTMISNASTLRTRPHLKTMNSIPAAAIEDMMRISTIYPSNPIL